MSERRVSVRLGVVGDEKVKKSLRVIGVTGKESFAEIERASTRAGRAGSKFGTSMKSVRGPTFATGSAVQNAAFQIGDFAVQVGAGTSATRALAMQLPQLLGGFGLFGAVLGGGAAILGALATQMGNTEDATGDLVDRLTSTESSLEGVRGSMEGLRGIQEGYRDAIAATGTASASAAGIVAANSRKEFDARRQVLQVEMELLRIRSAERAVELQSLRSEQSDEFFSAARASEGPRGGGIRRDMRLNRQGLEDQNVPNPASFPDDVQESLERRRLAIRRLQAEQSLLDIALDEGRDALSTEFRTIEGAAAGAADAIAGSGGGGGGGGGGGSGGSVVRAVEKMTRQTDVAAQGWRTAQDALASYAQNARLQAEQIGSVMTGAFGRAEDAIAQFVVTGKADVKSLVQSIAADLARLAARRLITGPLADAVAGAFIGPPLSAIPAGVGHSGGMVDGLAVRRSVPASVFAGAPRAHSGMYLAPDERPVIAQTGERILNRAETRAYQNGTPSVTLNVDARGAQQGVAEQIDQAIARRLPDIMRASAAHVRAERARGRA